MRDQIQTGLGLFAQAVARAGDRTAVYYFTREVSYRQFDADSDRLAAWLGDQGLKRGDRVLAFMQNTPEFITTLLATWKAGGVFVPVNPMNRTAELTHIIEDATPVAIVLEPQLHQEVYARLPEGLALPPIVLTAAPQAGLAAPDPRLFAADLPVEAPGVPTIQAAIAAGGETGPAVAPAPEHTAMLVYTSGTTGKPKGAISRHIDVARGGALAQHNMHMPDGETLLVIAPLFHITGLAMNIFAAFNAAGSMILSYRFHPTVLIEAIRLRRPHTTVGAITAFLALSNDPTATREAFSSFRMIASGGAPMGPAHVKAFEDKFGHTLIGGYGMTEASGVVVMVPVGEPQRVDPDTGALSVGKPGSGCTITIVGDDDQPVGPGEVGEVIINASTTTPGYWRLPEATAATFHPLGLRSGDVGKLDADGWLYLVDRKKDMIIAGGYKVWPREVEDVIYQHPAIREAAVVSAPDAYRGETVKAVVSLKAGATCAPNELIAFCKDRLAAYKYPRVVEIIDELPKTASGKILRRSLRGEQALG